MNVLFGVLGQESFAGEPCKLSNELYREISDCFSESNEIVRQRWFPERETLFKDSSQSRPSSSEPDDVDYVETALAQDLIQNLLKKELRVIQGGRTKRPVL